MTIQRPEDLETYLLTKVRSGQFTSEAAVVAEAVRQFQRWEREREAERDRVESLLIAGLDSGPSTPMTAEDWHEIERDGLAIIAARKADGVR